MKIIATGDLHYGLKKIGDLSTEKIAKEVNTSDADVFIIAGDIGDGLEKFETCLNLFSEFKGSKLLVPGNHDIWDKNKDSFKIYLETLKEISERNNFHYLDREPYILEEYGFVGNIGWYDYSFRLEELDIPIKYYEEKYLPKVARWNDKKYIDWGYNDYEVLDILLKKMEDHIEKIYKKIDKIICITHHLPFKNMTIKTDYRAWDFAQAYLGSVKMGELYMKYDKIKLAICGHSHRGMTIKEGNLKCINVGSTYKEKQIVNINL